MDAVRAAVRQRKLAQGAGRFEVTWDATNRTLTWDDNGIGMDTATILEKFLVIGESGTWPDRPIPGAGAQRGA